MDTDLTADDLKELAKEFKSIYKSETGTDFPDNPLEQLKLAINAVFGSWFGDRAVKYRKLHGIPESQAAVRKVFTTILLNRLSDTSYLLVEGNMHFLTFSKHDLERRKRNGKIEHLSNGLQEARAFFQFILQETAVR